MDRFFLSFILALLGLSSVRCTYSSGSAPVPAPLTGSGIPSSGFNDYWYRGKAEICTYQVEQERYGEMRPAEQVNIFVTEDFSGKKEVKLDDPGKAESDRVPVLKLNVVRRFHTGIYDYNLMASVFTPVNATPSLKATYSVFDWCGQVFTQFNLDKNEYRIRSFSYFETEGDQDMRLGNTMLEDEILTRLRINPAGLPAGKVNLIPSAFYLRFRHQPFRSHPAVLSAEAGEKESRIRIGYEDIPRTLVITYETAFPNRILGWEEMDNGKILSKGTLKSSLMTDYWRQHDNASAGLRDSLKLMF